MDSAVKIELYHDIDLHPIEPKGVDISKALKNYLLFAEIDEKIYAFGSVEYLPQSLSFLSKLEEQYDFKVLDEESYERLYNRFLELKADRDIASMQEESEEESEEEFSLTEFLRTSSDILSSEESAPIIKFVN
ncbi:MAG: type II/IV secretion system protein, partial [Epsilonproteobacteria bacterium]|nr:type II/IV secretion system protein [Campylobacterota bacterium]